MGDENRFPTGENVKKLRLSIALPALAVACCVPKSPDPVPPPPPPTASVAPVAAAPAASRPVAVQSDVWLDQPQTTGDWSYTDGASLSYATFGQAGEPARFGIECAKPSRTVRLVRGGTAPSATTMRILTETTNGAIAVMPSPDGRPLISGTVPATDTVLEAMAFTKGRFAIETGGLPTLYVPSWPEVTRVIEDCR